GFTRRGSAGYNGGRSFPHAQEGDPMSPRFARLPPGIVAALLLVCPAQAAAPPVGSTQRDRHGDPLPPAAVARMGTVRFNHWLVMCVAFSRDSKYLVSGGLDRHVRIWDRRTGKEVRHFKSDAVNCLAFSPDGR